ncbi:MAG: 3',5'-cyclic-AMP phosphodiesterase [Burkholderiaceae bacterium]|nr:3',5'-cyclic-AMP phosphodiesterase [Burkholderiaceae bacterium]
MPVTLVQLTDPHLFADPEGRLLNVNTDASLRAVLQDIAVHHPSLDLLLATGDIAQDGSLAAYQRFLQLAAAIPAPLRGLPGNHDVRANFHDAWQDKAQTIADVGNWRIVLLDSIIPGSNAGALEPDQLALLKTAAQQAGNKHILVALHHNPVAVGSQWLDTMMVSNGQKLLQVIEDLPNVRALLWGHVHQEYDSVHHYAQQGREVRLLATPSTCVQFTPASSQFSLDAAGPGYRWLTLHPDGRLDTGVRYVHGLNLKPDTVSGGY